MVFLLVPGTSFVIMFRWTVFQFKTGRSVLTLLNVFNCVTQTAAARVKSQTPVVFPIRILYSGPCMKSLEWSWNSALNPITYKDSFPSSETLIIKWDWALSQFTTGKFERLKKATLSTWDTLAVSHFQILCRRKTLTCMTHCKTWTTTLQDQTRKLPTCSTVQN